MPPRAQTPPTVVVGPTGSGKTTAALAEYGVALARRIKAMNAARRQVWIAPTRAVAADIREALVDPQRAILDPGVTTFPDLAAEFLREAGARLRPITPLQRRRLLGRLIDEAAAAGRLPYFAPVAGSPGLVARVDQGIAELQHSGRPPTVNAAGDDPAARDIADLYARYESVLAAADLVDVPGLLRTANQVLAASRASEKTINLVVVDGFTDFNALELDLLARLAAHSQRMLITLPGEGAGWHAQGPPQGVGSSKPAQPRPTGDLGRATPRADLFAGIIAVAGRLVHDLGSNIELVKPPRHHPWPALAHLERNLFRNVRDVEPVAPDAVASLGRVQIVAASGVQAEIDELARRIKQLLIDGAAPGDVVVAFRSTRDVADRVRQAFDDFGIPMALDAPRQLATTPLVRSLTNVLWLAAEDWSYRRLLRVAADDNLRLFDAEATARTALETCVRHAQLPSGRSVLFAELERWAQRDDEGVEPTSAAAQIALAALRELAATLDRLPRRATIDRWVAALGPLAERLGLIRPATGDAAGNWAILTGALNAAGQLDAWTGWGGEELTLAAFVELMASAAAAAPAASRHNDNGRVRVLSAERARFTRPKHLLVGGLSEQAFPAAGRSLGAKDENGQFAAAARSAEMLLFYQLVARPTETLTLSYPALDERAQTLPASPFLTELERAFGDAELPRTVQPLDGGRRAVAHGANPLSRSGLRRTAVASALEGDRKLLATVLQVGGPAILDAMEAVADRSGREFGAFEGLVQSDAGAARLRDRFGPGHLWSPSQLERYATCPFVFFGETLLNLRPLPELALESDVRRRGSVLHETLARLYGELQGQRLDPDQVAAVLIEQFHAALVGVAEARPGRGLDAALREIERRQIAAWAESFARQDAEYRAQWTTMDCPPEPAHFEVRFGPDTRRRGEPDEATLSTDKPFPLGTTIDDVEEQVQFTGRIDRIDVGRVGDRTVFNVIDYKTSKYAAVKEEEIHAGRQLQLPLYALAVEGLLLDKEHAVPLSAGYWSVKGKGFARGGRSTGALDVNQVRQGALEPAPAWAQTRAALVERIGQIIADIRRGRFPVYNVDPQCTSTCDLRTICRIAQIRSLEKQWSPGSNVEKQT